MLQPRTLFTEYKPVLIAFVVIYAIRLIIAQQMGLMPQDAYYYLYSEHLALSYFDHPPMVAYMLKTFSFIFGKSVTAVKMTDFIISLLTFIGFFYFARLLLSSRKALHATLFFGSTMMLTIVSINTTPDVPLMLFWIVTLIVFYKTITHDRPYLWVLSGILMGCSFDSKYTGLFLIFGALLFLVLSEKHRHYLISWRPLILVAMFCLTIFPVFYWNVQHDWMSFKFQSANRMEGISRFVIHPKNFLGNIVLQAMILIPVFFGALWFVFYRLAKKLAKTRQLFNEKVLFLLSFSFPMIGFFFAVSIFYWVKMNWIMPGYMTAIVLASIYLSRHVLKYQMIAAVVLHVLLFIQVAFYPVNVKSDDTWYGWEELSAEVEALKDEYPDHFIFANDGYKTSAVLSFYLEERIYSGNVIGKNGLQFSVLDKDLSFLDGTNALFIDSDKRFKDINKSKLVREDLRPYFDKVVQLDPILIGLDPKKPLRKFLVYECLGYNGD